MKTRMVLLIVLIGFVHAGCFHGEIKTNYATDADTLVASKRPLPVVAGLVFSEEEQQRQDHVRHFGFKVRVDTGTATYELSKAWAAKLFDGTTEVQKIKPDEETNLFLKPRIEELDIRVEGFLYTYFAYLEVAGLISLEAYDSQGVSIWSGKRPVDYRSGRAVHALWLLVRRNKITTDAYKAIVLKDLSGLVNEFYYSEELQDYLCSIGKCTRQSLEKSHPALGAEGGP